MIVADAGALYALANKKDAHHKTCVEYFKTIEPPILVPSLIVAEVAYLLQSRLGGKAETAFIKALAIEAFKFVDLTSADLQRVAELTEQYEDLPIGVADASVVAIAERFNVSEIATVDTRHFRVIRPKHVEAFEIKP